MRSKLIDSCVRISVDSCIHIFTRKARNLTLNVRVTRDRVYIYYDIRPKVIIDGKQWLLDPIHSNRAYISSRKNLEGLKAAAECHGFTIPQNLLKNIAKVPDGLVGRANSRDAGIMRHNCLRRTKYYDFISKTPYLSQSDIPITIPSEYEFLVKQAKLVKPFFKEYCLAKVLKELSRITSMHQLRQFVDHIYEVENHTYLNFNYGDWRVYSDALGRQRRLIEE